MPTKRLTTFKRISGVLGLCFWMASCALWYRYALTRPAIRQPGAGRVYSLNTHGTVVYLTSQEHFLLYFLMVTGAVFLFLAVGLHLFGKRLDRQKPTA